MPEFGGGFSGEPVPVGEMKQFGLGMAKDLTTPLFSRAGNALSDWIFGKSKKQSGQEAGAWAKDYYNSAFPGTTPWEQLGAGNPGGQIESADMANKSALRLENKKMANEMTLKNKELATTERIADKNNQTQLDIHTASNPDNGTRENLVSIQLKSLQAHLDNLASQTNKNYTEAELKEKESNAYYYLQGAHVANDTARTIASYIGLGNFRKAAQTLKEVTYTSGDKQVKYTSGNFSPEPTKTIQPKINIKSKNPPKNNQYPLYKHFDQK